MGREATRPIRSNTKEIFMNTKPVMLTINEAAAAVAGLTKYRIRQMCLEGTLPHIKAGKKYLINLSALLEAIGEKPQ
jgi:excisionase family DNA binding protein